MAWKNPQIKNFKIEKSNPRETDGRNSIDLILKIEKNVGNKLLNGESNCILYELIFFLVPAIRIGLVKSSLITPRYHLGNINPRQFDFLPINKPNLCDHS